MQTNMRKVEGVFKQKRDSSNWSDVATSQRLSVATRSLGVRNRISLRIFKRSIAQLLLDTFLLFEFTEQFFLYSSHQTPISVHVTKC